MNETEYKKSHSLTYETLFASDTQCLTNSFTEISNNEREEFKDKVNRDSVFYSEYYCQFKVSDPYHDSF